MRRLELRFPAGDDRDIYLEKSGFDDVYDDVIENCNEMFYRICLNEEVVL